MTALLVIDMQVGLFTEDTPRHDAEGVVRRINALGKAVRLGGGLVIFVQDGHTTADRPHIDAVSVIRHHNWLWQNLIHPKRQIKVLPAASVVAHVESSEHSSRPTIRRRRPG